jgi:hypothetical protein
MKKSTASITLAAITGLTLLSATPAMAAPFQNCDQAATFGVYNIPVTSPLYNPGSDSDKDGVACENSDIAFDPSGVPVDPAPTATPAPTVVPVAPVAQTPQVAQMPVGGASTGVAQDTTDNSAAVALGAGAVLVALAGGTFMVRRRTAQA